MVKHCGTWLWAKPLKPAHKLLVHSQGPFTLYADMDTRVYARAHIVIEATESTDTVNTMNRPGRPCVARMSSLCSVSLIATDTRVSAGAARMRARPRAV